MTRNNRQEVIDWAAETGAGYKAAAKQFNIPRDTVKKWLRVARAAKELPAHVPPPPRPKLKPRPKRVAKAKRTGRQVGRDLDEEFGRSVPPAEAKLIRDSEGTARDAIGTMTKGLRIVGITKGQFSLLDVIRVVAEQIGPCSLDVSTWTAGTHDVEALGWMYSEQELLAVRLLIDASMPARKPHIARRFAEVLGLHSIRLTNTHAKIAILRNAEWSVVIRGSFNLSRNPRFEQFDLDESEEIADIFTAHFDLLWEGIEQGMEKRSSEVTSVFKRLFGASIVTGTINPPLPPLSLMDPVPFWRSRLDTALAQASQSMERGHANVAATWEKIGQTSREKLDEALSADAKRLAREAKAAVRDPAQLASSLVAMLPKALEVSDSPELVDRVWSAIEKWKESR